jgi:hypothetical protein
MGRLTMPRNLFTFILLGVRVLAKLSAVVSESCMTSAVRKSLACAVCCANPVRAVRGLRRTTHLPGTAATSFCKVQLDPTPDCGTEGLAKECSLTPDDSNGVQGRQLAVLVTNQGPTSTSAQEPAQPATPASPAHELLAHASLAIHTRNNEQRGIELPDRLWCAQHHSIWQRTTMALKRRFSAMAQNTRNDGLQRYGKPKDASIALDDSTCNVLKQRQGALRRLAAEMLQLAPERLQLLPCCVITRMPDLLEPPPQMGCDALMRSPRA